MSNLISLEEYNAKIVVTNREKVASTTPSNLSGLMPCNQEEADTRMILHAADGITEGCKRIVIRTVDTDVVVIAIALVQSLPGCEKFWIAFGVGKMFRFLDITAMSEALGPEKCAGLLAFHAFTGCDITSCFKGHGKRTAWLTWNVLPSVNEAFRVLSNSPTPEQVMDVLPLVERFVVVLYERCSEDEEVNKARKHLFIKGRDIENLPPSQDALILHTLRAAFQAGHIWRKSLQKYTKLPDPAKFGWRKAETGWLVRKMLQGLFI